MNYNLQRDETINFRDPLRRNEPRFYGLQGATRTDLPPITFAPPPNRPLAYDARHAARHGFVARDRPSSEARASDDIAARIRAIPNPYDRSRADPRDRAAVNASAAPPGMRPAADNAPQADAQPNLDRRRNGNGELLNSNRTQQPQRRVTDGLLGVRFERWDVRPAADNAQRAPPAASLAEGKTLDRAAVRESIGKLREENGQSTNRTLRYCRLCPICKEFPQQRAAFTECGHIICLACAQEMKLVAAETVAALNCPTCRKSSAFIKLWEHQNEEEALNP